MSDRELFHTVMAMIRGNKYETANEMVHAIIQTVWQEARKDPTSGESVNIEIKMDDEIRWILGRPNFACAGIAQYLRSQGREIQNKAEDEQAEAIHWMLNLYSQHGAEWRQRANELLSESTTPQEQ